MKKRWRYLLCSPSRLWPRYLMPSTSNEQLLLLLMFPGFSALHLEIKQTQHPPAPKFQNCCPIQCTNSKKLQKRFQKRSKTKKKKISHQKSLKAEGPARIIIFCARARSRNQRKALEFQGKIETNIPVLKCCTNYLRNKIPAGKGCYLTSFIVAFSL